MKEASDYDLAGWGFIARQVEIRGVGGFVDVYVCGWVGMEKGQYFILVLIDGLIQLCEAKLTETCPV